MRELDNREEQQPSEDNTQKILIQIKPSEQTEIISHELQQKLLLLPGLSFLYFFKFLLYTMLSTSRQTLALHNHILYCF